MTRSFRTESRNAGPSRPSPKAAYPQYGFTRKGKELGLIEPWIPMVFNGFHSSDASSKPHGRKPQCWERQHSHRERLGHLCSQPDWSCLSAETHLEPTDLGTCIPRCPRCPKISEVHSGELSLMGKPYLKVTLLRFTRSVNWICYGKHRWNSSGCPRMIMMVMITINSW